VLNEVGTASEMIAMPVPGRGHILCVIPWRSVGELGSLMGSRGDDTVTSVYSSDCDTLKKLLLTLRVRNDDGDIITKPALFHPSVKLVWACLDTIVSL